MVNKLASKLDELDEMTLTDDELEQRVADILVKGYDEWRLAQPDSGPSLSLSEGDRQAFAAALKAAPPVSDRRKVLSKGGSAFRAATGATYIKARRRGPEMMQRKQIDFFDIGRPQNRKERRLSVKFSRMRPHATMAGIVR